MRRSASKDNPRASRRNTLRIGLVCPELWGHLLPLTSLGQALQQRGHRVVVYGGNLSREIADRQGLGHVPLGEKNALAGELQRCWTDLGTRSGLSAALQTGRGLNLSARMLVEDLPDALERHPADGLVIDQVSPGGVLAADRHQLPYVVASNALAIHFGPSVPPPPLPWRYRDDWIGNLRNRIAWRTIIPLYSWLAGSRKVGVSPELLIFNHELGLARIAQQPAFFEFPNQPHPSHFHFTAPWHTPGRDRETEFPWDRLDGRPLVYASMGSLQNNQRKVFQAICDAVRGLPVQVVLTRGGAAGTLDLDPPDNVVLVPRAPQLRLLDKAVLAITHAGLNTAMECLARGVPMVCLPVTNDQPGVARRIDWLGAGLMVPVARATPTRIRALVQRVLGDPSFAHQTQALRDQLPERPGVDLAADIVEQALQTRQRVERL